MKFYRINSDVTLRGLSFYRDIGVNIYTIIGLSVINKVLILIEFVLN